MEDGVLQRTLGRMEGRIEAIDGKVDTLIQSLSYNEDKVTGLENWKSKVTGIAAAVSAGVTIVLAVIGLLLGMR